jgi:hypothetical protein
VKYVWICECSVGTCEFDTKREADESYHGKFCGLNPVVRRVRR